MCTTAATYCLGGLGNVTTPLQPQLTFTRAISDSDAKGQASGVPPLGVFHPGAKLYIHASQDISLVQISLLTVHSS